MFCLFVFEAYTFTNISLVITFPNVDSYFQKISYFVSFNVFSPTFFYSTNTGFFL